METLNFKSRFRVQMMDFGFITGIGYKSFGGSRVAISILHTDSNNVVAEKLRALASFIEKMRDENDEVKSEMNTKVDYDQMKFLRSFG